MLPTHENDLTTVAPLILYPSRRRWILILAGVAFFGWIVWRLPIGAAIINWAALIFCLVGVLVSILMLVPGSAYLRLEPAGFTLRTFFRDQFVPWDDVDRFFAHTINTGHSRSKVVGFNYRPGTKRQRRWHAFSQYLTGADDCLGDTYGQHFESLAELMEEWRQRYSTSG